ncbi:MAG: GNAT family N-acetyltransferase [Beijerinckiaceae bacterium]
MPSTAEIAVALRQAAPEDELFLRGLFAAVRGPEFAAAGLPGAMVAQLLGQQYRAQQAGYAAAFPQASSLVILREGVSVGRVLLAGRPSGEGWALHIVDIAILPTRQGQGIGSDVIEALARAARSDGAAGLSLSVLSTNTKARRLYERLGFTEAGAGVYTAMIKRL